MNIELHPENIRRDRHTAFIIVDFIMLGLIIVNLSWIIFDGLFGSHSVQTILLKYSPGFFVFYRDTLHADFILYDLVFVTIFIIELLIRWTFAIINKTYYRWFFYPFVHWYDVLGCIPVGSFRFLRLLRVISILYRLQKHGIVDLTNTYPFRFAEKYIKIVVEEISDRVVVNVLNGVQSEIRSGTPVVHKITNNVFLPRKELLVVWISDRIKELVETSYESRRGEVKSLLDDVIVKSIRRNPDLSNLSKIPFMGDTLSGKAESIISDIAYNILDQVIGDLKTGQQAGLIHEMSDVFINSITEPQGEFNETIKTTLLESIELIKDEVKIQQWKNKI